MRKLLVIAVCFAFVAPAGARASHPDDVYWHPWMGTGPDSPVWAMAVYDGDLIVAGDFTTIGGVAANHIAAWNGDFWSPLGTGIETPVRHLAVYDGKLIAGTNFDAPIGGWSHLVTAWDGFSWSPMSSDSHSVTVLQCSDGELVAGWRDSGCSGEICWESCWVSSWNGSSWDIFGSFISQDWTPVVFPPATVRFLTRYDSQWVAGGSFSHASGVRVGSLAAYDGESWSPLDSWNAYTMWLYASTVRDSALIVGGAFGNLSAWDGSSWSMIEPQLGEFDFVGILGLYDGDLIVGGEFDPGSGGVPSEKSILTNIDVSIGKLIFEMDEK
ncbi:MAG: hypothetical protein GTO29_11760, partial [Candidatus Latescibacteria bacterium]|nr:hypothetical protein [Candidatus Latescibacterota bacterium]NIO56843.1 hypothetical protein [Candidatus Latescibacterota bacterium]